VRLAEVSCTEGCCTRLYVTIVRDGDSVVWRDWRGHTSTAPPPELRFAAHRYGTELTRTEIPETRATVVGGTRDHAGRLGYAWPARGR
jgi:hypothetical protein